MKEKTPKKISELTGETPYAVLEQKRKYEELAEPQEPDIDEPETEPYVVTDKVIPKPKIPRYIGNVKIENDSLLFEFPVTDFCETELALIFVLSPDDFRVTPKSDSRFTLTYSGRDYGVLYIGKPIYFSNYGIHQIIFIKDMSESTDDND